MLMSHASIIWGRIYQKMKWRDGSGYATSSIEVNVFYELFAPRLACVNS